MRLPCVKTRPAALTGFTLVELLVSVAIIGLLLAILLPSLKTARNQARRVACLASLKGVATASLTYSGSDPHEQMIPVHGLYGVGGADFVAYDYGGKSGIGEPQSGVDPASSAWGTQNGRGPATRPLNGVLMKSGFVDHQNTPGPNQINWLNDTQLDIGLFRCPSDRGYVGLHFEAWENSGLSSYDHYGTSYAASVLWDGTPFAGTSECVLYSISAFLHPASRIPNPANTLLYTENGTRFGWLHNLVEEPNPEDTASFSACGKNVPFVVAGRAKVRGWHGQDFLSMASFADGHAGPIEMEGHQRPVPPLPYYPALWQDIGTPGTYETIRCAVIRGKGWQLDALPAPSVRSEVLCNQADTVFLTER